MKAACSALLVLALLSTAGMATADWRLEDGHKMHWPQLPDRDGWDVNCTMPLVLADDFLCTGTGPITGIHVWVSWQGDRPEPQLVQSIELSIHRDIPADPPQIPFSKPQEPPLWRTNITERYTIRQMEPSLQGWYDPMGGIVETNDHETWFLYNFSFSPEEAFEQIEGNIYWLNVAFLMAPEAMGMAGWKTSGSYHFLDDAVWRPYESQNPQEDWQELRDPLDPSISLDLAFVIQGGPPGETELDFGDAPDSPAGALYPTLLPGGARHVLTANGPFFGQWVEFDPDGQPSPQADGDDIVDGTDDEDGIVFPPVLTPGSSYNFTVDLSASPAGGYVSAWVDYNGNMSWGDPGEQILSDHPLPAGAAAAPFTRTVPAGAAIGTTYARFRVTTAPGIGPGGLAPDGEVEDYVAQIEEEEEPEPEYDIKWYQPLDPVNPVDVPSYLSQEPFEYAWILDDFQSDGRPIVGIRWWGSYPGYAPDEPGPVPPPLTGGRPGAFYLDWYTDIPAGVATNYSIPGKRIMTGRYPLAGWGYTALVPGVVVERYYTTAVHHATGAYEHEYVYDLLLPEPWNEKEKHIYWLGVQADYGLTPPEQGWGWATTSLDHEWNDDAVSDELTGEIWAKELRYVDVDPRHPYDTNSVNMAFVLFTDVLGRRNSKWMQPPDMMYGENMPSWTTLDHVGVPGWPLRADDFISDGRRITDLHWWGSYIDWLPLWREPDPPPAPTNFPNGLLGFRVSWHHDVPAGALDPWSQPQNPPITEFFVPIEKCHEVFYGSVTQTWKSEEWLEHEYQYYLDLMDPELEQPGAWPEEEGVIYWLNIQAVFPAEFQAGGEHGGWGWKSTPPEHQWHDVSVVATNYVGGQPDWEAGAYPTNHPFGNPEGGALLPLDLAFELTTDEGSTSEWWYADIRFTHIDDDSATNYLMTSKGVMGMGDQVLEMCTDLVVSNWTPVATNPAPLPPAWMHNWTDALPHSTSEYYRVIQKP